MYVSIRADLGIKTLITGDVDYLYSVGTIIRGAVLGLPDESVLQSAIDGQNRGQRHQAGEPRRRRRL